MKSKRFFLIGGFLAVLVVLTVAGTKLSRMTRTTAIQSSSRFYVVTQATDGKFYSRYILAPDLATNLGPWLGAGSGTGEVSTAQLLVVSNQTITASNTFRTESDGMLSRGLTNKHSVSVEFGSTLGVTGDVTNRANMYLSGGSNPKLRITSVTIPQTLELSSTGIGTDAGGGQAYLTISPEGSPAFRMHPSQLEFINSGTLVGSLITPAGKVFARTNHADSIHLTGGQTSGRLATISSGTNILASAATETEAGYLSGVTGPIQPEIANSITNFLQLGISNAISKPIVLRKNSRVLDFFNLVEGANVTITPTSTGYVFSAASGSLSDGDKGDITVSGSGTLWSLDIDTVTDAVLRESAGFSVIGKSTTGTGNPADIVAGTDSVFGRSGSGNLGFAQVATGQIAADAVTYAKIQNVTSGRFLGRSSSGSGDTEELSAGAGIYIAGGSVLFDPTNRAFYGTTTAETLDATALDSGTLTVTGVSELGNVFMTSLSVSTNAEISGTNRSRWLRLDGGQTNNSVAIIDANTNVVGHPTVTVTELGYLDGVTSAIQTQLGQKQAASVMLDSFSALAANGVVVVTDSDLDELAVRTITGTASEITVADGNGVAGNPTISLPSLVNLGANSGITTSTGNFVRVYATNGVTTGTDGSAAGSVTINATNGLAGLTQTVPDTLTTTNTIQWTLGVPAVNDMFYVASVSGQTAVVTNGLPSTVVTIAGAQTITGAKTVGTINSTTNLNVNAATVTNALSYVANELSGAGTSNTNYTALATGKRRQYLNAGKTNIAFVAIMGGQTGLHDPIVFIATNRTADVCTMTLGATTNNWVNVGSLAAPFSITNALWLSTETMGSNTFYAARYLALPAP